MGGGVRVLEVSAAAFGASSVDEQVQLVVAEQGVDLLWEADGELTHEDEHVASVGFPPADATTPVVSVKDYVWDNLEWILDRYCEPRRGDPRSLSELGAAADAISAAVAVEGGSWLDHAKFDAWFEGTSYQDGTPV